MLVVVSPAKKMDMSPVEGVTPTRPAFRAEAEDLAQVARQRPRDSAELARLIGDKYAERFGSAFLDVLRMAD